MSAHRFSVTSKKLSADVEIADAGDRAAFAYASLKGDVAPAQLGNALWAAMREAGVKPQDVNNFIIREASGEENLVAAVYPVLEGAHAVWMVLYRADRDSSCFRALPSRKRVGDALDAAFAELTKEVVRPHKP